MNGVGRRQIWSPDGTRLYTLYIRQTHHHLPDGTEHATGAPGTDGFVHVLDLTDEWAFCLDLPSTFGGGDLATTALAVAPDGKTIAVADLSAGQVPFASTADLEVTNTAPIASFELAEEVQLGMTANELVVGLGTELHWFDQQSMQTLGDSVDLKISVTAITSNGNNVLVWGNDQASAPVSLPAPQR
jgi:WD40 repeat protein